MESPPASAEVQSPSGQPHRSRFSRFALFGCLLVLVAGAAAAAGFYAGNSHRKSQPTASLPRSHGTTTRAPASTTIPGSASTTESGLPAGTITVASAPGASASIATTLSDLPSGFVNSGTSTYPGPAASALPPQVCTPVSGKPWDGYTTASFGSVGANEGVTATVTVMPTPQMAQDAVDSVLASSFGPDCLQPSFDAYVKRNAVNVGEPADCGSLVFSNSTIERLATPDMGWRYAGNERCQVSSDPYTSTSFRDELLATHGPIVMEVDFTSSSPPLALEEHLVALMELRAGAYGTGLVVSQNP